MSHLSVADPRAAFVQVRDELMAALAGVVDSGDYIIGKQVGAFEREWASYCGTAEAVGVSSGTDALALALRAVGIGPGDEVLVPAMTAIATWMAVCQVGATPVGVDVVPEGYGMNPVLAKAALGPRTRAVVAVHLFGQPADVDGLATVAQAAKIPLIEDAAQAHGARAQGRRIGSIGSLAAFSFYPTKNLGAIGDAGAVTTSDPELADRVRRLRQYGWRTRSDTQLAGVNARLDEIQAAVLRVMLQGLEAATKRRRSIANIYIDGLAGIPELELPSEPPGTESVWHLFVVHHPARDELAASLSRHGIESAVHYMPAPHLNTVFRDMGCQPGDFPVAERHAATALSLPMYPSLSDGDTARIIEAVRNASAGLKI